MVSDERQTEALIERELIGDDAALRELFSRYRPRLETMLLLRMGLRGRLDTSVVLREAFKEVRRRAPGFSKKRDLPFYLWLRRVSLKCLVKLQERHFGEAAALEVSFRGGRSLAASGFSLASLLLGRSCSEREKANRERQRANLEETLESLEPLDREILALRHLEKLSNSEAAVELGIDERVARRTYVCALRHLREVLGEAPSD